MLSFAILFALCVLDALPVGGEQVAVACEQSTLKITCRKDENDQSKGVIIIQRAIYGREDNRTCRAPGDTRTQLYDPGKCSSLVDMTAVVRYHCQFQPSCRFDISEVPFDFECSDIVAYLRVSYNCLPLIGDLPRAAPSTPTPAPRTTITPSTTSEVLTTPTPTTTSAATTPPLRANFENKNFVPASSGRATSANTVAIVPPSSVGNIAQAIISEALAESAPGGHGSEVDKPGPKSSLPLNSPNDLMNGWGTCPECNFCLERAGRIKCFFVLHNLTWPEAKQSCADQGGELATIRSEMETRFINRTKFILGMHNNNAWIGLRWKQPASAWLWTDDVALDWELSYSAFAPGEPDNWNGWESCVEFVGADIYHNQLGFYTGFWNDQECLLRRDALCQKYWILA